ncbi:MAG: hypothetical protein M3P97_10455 [Actinomycetota bacterium]|jgi:hypothetical protein|nr:hypothetical protein [Actinomycetota bacterium]
MCDSFDRGEGEISITAVTVRTHPAHLVRFSFTATGVRVGDELTATVTKTGDGDELTQPSASTGEFSPCSWVE